MKRRKITRSAEDAVLSAEKEGELISTSMLNGKVVAQRPIRLEDESLVSLDPGERVKVYNKRGSRVFCSDCVLEPLMIGEILRSDLERPCVSRHVLVVGQ